MKGFSKRLKGTLLVAAGIAVMAGAGSAYWYFSIYTKTPDYALQKIEESLEKNNKDEFYRYVNMEHMVDSGSDVLLYSMLNTMVSGNEDDKQAAEDLTKMFKAPVSHSLQNAINNFVATGHWIEKDTAPDDDMILTKAGVSQIEFLGIDSVEKDGEDNAVANIRVFQKEAGEEYVLNLLMVKTEDGQWQAYEMVNLGEFIEFVSSSRKAHVQKYMNEANEIMTSYDSEIRDIEKRLHMEVATNSLGDDAFRQELKQIVTEEMLKKWQEEKAALEALDVPVAANTLHKLRLKICDANISYAENYAKWLDDKNIQTIRKAEESMKQAKTLEQEAKHLIRQVQAHIK